jgi:PAS domain S-box-containing protein
MSAPTESRELLRDTLSSIGDAVITTDAEGAITFLNPVAETLTGWTNDQALGKDLALVFRIVNEETHREVENPALHALRAGLVVGLANHTLLIARDGAERSINDSAAPIRNDQGDIVGVVVVFRDITERREQEHAIQHALTYAQGIISTIRESLVVLDSDLRVRSANRAFYKTFQIAPHDVEGRFIYDIGDRQWDIPKLRTLLEDVLPQNHSFEEFEIEHEFKGIGRKFMVLNARRVKEGEELILLAIEDVTERRVAQRQVGASEVRYRKLFETAKDGILILDADNGKITDANPYVAELIGLQSSDLIGKELWQIGLFQDIRENKAAFRQLRREGYVQYDHLPLNSTTGETIPVEFVSNMYREDGRLVAQCNVRSIGERRLRDQNRALADENRRKDEFLAMLSHELRNPLAPIRSAVHLLRTQPPGGSEDPVQQQAREIIERQVGNLTKLISDLLEVSRVLTGRIRLDLQLQDLNLVVERAIETLRPFIDQRRHKVTLHACKQPAWVSADATRMEEVFVNILNNAIKYTPEGGNDGRGGHIEVWCEQVRGGHSESQEGHAQVRIRDNGEGIDKALLPRIFDLFTQADRSLARSAGGLGIGLALAHRIVQLHGGTIEAHSPPQGGENGTEVIIGLPLSRPEPRWDADSPVQHSEEQTTASQASKGIRVLVVDDNVDLVMMFAITLRHKGYSVQTAFDGPEGLKLAQTWRPDVVLLDIGLPGMDGYQVARQLRKDPATAGIRLIAVTGYGREGDKEKSRDAGFDAHVVKPCSVDELEKLITPPPATPSASCQSERTH